MITFIAWICIINEFVENNQGTDDVGHTSNISKVAENNVIWKHPRNQKKYSLKLLTLCRKAWVHSKTQVYFYHQQPLKNSGRNAIQYIVSRIRYQYSENLVADEKVYVNLIPFIVTYTFFIHSRYNLYKTKKDTVNAILFIVTYTFFIQ